MCSAATILHADLDAFYASVEQMLDPLLRGRPIAVGGGVVLAASYEAKAFGVRVAACPVGGRESSARSSSLSAATSATISGSATPLIAVLGDFTPRVERISIDEAFADVAGCTHLFGTPAQIAERIRRRVRDELGTADLGRRGADQAPGEDRLAGGQARRSGRGCSRHPNWLSSTISRSS